MKKILPFAAGLALLLPVFSAAQQVRFSPEPDFESVVGRAIAQMAPADAFAAPACRAADARFIQAVSLEDARKMLAPCLSSISQRYGAEIKLDVGTVSEQGRIGAQVQVLILSVPEGVSLTSPVMRDLNHGLTLRRNQLLGHPVVLKRQDPHFSAESETNSANPAQQALARCVMPMVMRRIESGSDFIRYYGGCLRQDKALGIVGLQPWAGHRMGVILVTSASRPVAESLDTSVSVTAANGPVQIDLIAYTQPVYRP